MADDQKSNGHARLGDCNVCHAHSLALSRIEERTAHTSRLSDNISQHMAEMKSYSKQSADSLRSMRDDRKADRFMFMVFACAICLIGLLQAVAIYKATVSLHGPNGTSLHIVPNAVAQPR